MDVFEPVVMVLDVSGKLTGFLVCCVVCRSVVVPTGERRFVSMMSSRC